MGIFMITISQISSHTAVGVFPSAPLSTRHGSLHFSLDELAPVSVVLRDLECRPGALGVDAARRLDPDRKAAEHLEELDVALLPNADPARARDGPDTGVGQRPTAAIAAEDVEPRIEQAPLVELAEHRVTPRRVPLTRRIDAGVAGVEERSVAASEGEALALDADSLDGGRVCRDPGAIHLRQTRVSTAVEPEDLSGRDHAAVDRLEPSGRAPVEQAARATAVRAAAGGDHQDGRRGDQPVQPQRATPPYAESLRYVR